MFEGFIAGIGAFLSYFAAGGAAMTVYMLVYTWVTPHNEVALIKEQNQAAAIAFSGSLLGFTIAISGLIENAIDLLDFGMWAVVAIIVQLLAYFAVRMVFPRISERIASGEVPAAVWLASASLAAGLLNAACMTY